MSEMKKESWKEALVHKPTADSLQVKQGSTSRMLDKDIYFTGGEFRIQ